MSLESINFTCQRQIMVVPITKNQIQQNKN